MCLTLGLTKGNNKNGEGFILVVGFGWWWAENVVMDWIGRYKVRWALGCVVGYK